MIADLASAELLSLTNIKSKSSEVAIPVPELPKCSSSIRLFAACVSGDQEVVAKVLSSISSSDGQQNVSASELEPSDLGISYSDSYSNCEDTIEQEQEHWDVLDILNMPSSLEGLATCLHVASELGETKRMCNIHV